MELLNIKDDEGAGQELDGDASITVEEVRQVMK